MVYVIVWCWYEMVYMVFVWVVYVLCAVCPNMEGHVRARSGARARRTFARCGARAGV